MHKQCIQTYIHKHFPAHNPVCMCLFHLLFDSEKTDISLCLWQIYYSDFFCHDYHAERMKREQRRESVLEEEANARLEVD